MPKRAASFDIQTSRDLLHKLERDIERLRRSTSREDVADHTFNAAMAAWHIHHWIARDIRLAREEAARDPSVPNYVARISEVRDDDFAKRFIKECPELEICKHLVNDTKHPGKQGTPAEVAYVTAGAMLVEPKGTQAGHVPCRGYLATKRNGKWETMNALNALERIHRYWERMIYELQIG